MAKQYRIEHDPLGKKKVPAGAHYGIHTQRALENFPISGMRPHAELIWALGAIKLAAAQANRALGVLDEYRARAISRAAEEVIRGKWNKEFLVDPFQAGAGTPWNMNANEVIANRAIEFLKGKKGDYKIVHPNDHVNLGQSTNDAMPTAMRLACLRMLPALVDACNELHAALLQKSREFMDIITTGRTHLQDAVPMLLGQEFSGYAAAVHKRTLRVAATQEFLARINLGGTAIGTGINTHPKYRKEVITRLNIITGFKLGSAENLFESTSSATDFLALSGTLRSLAVDLGKIADDFRLLSSGPRTGIAEITLPAVEPGSSIMPGKVNPSMAEMLNMACDQVIGNDLVISTAAQQGQLQLNVMLPVLAHNLLQSIKILTNAVREFTKRCAKGIRANRNACARYYKQSLGLATLLSPRIGYDAAARLAQEALRTGKTIRELVRTKNILERKEQDELLHPKNATRPNLRSRTKKQR